MDDDDERELISVDPTDEAALDNSAKAFCVGLMLLMVAMLCLLLAMRGAL